MACRIYSRPIIPFLISMIFGIASGSRFPGNSIWAYSIIFLCAGLIVFQAVYKKNLSVWPLVIFFAFGYLLIQPWVAPKFPSNHITHFTDNHRWKIVGVVDKNPAACNNRLRIILRVETLGRDNSSFPVLGKIRVTVTKPFPDIFVGDRLSLIGKIRSIRNFNNPGGFNYRRYMAFKKIWGSAYVHGKRIVILARNSDPGINTIIEKARNRISDLIDRTGEGNQQDVLKALIVGDRTGIAKNIGAAFNRAGIGHVLAISGLHIGIIATASFIFFQKLLSYIKFFLWNAWTKKGAAILSLFPVILYGLISGMSPSTQRAVIMVTVFLMTFLFEREQDPMNTLAMAAMIILVASPPSLFSISFQLSFIAVLSIIYGWSLRYIKSAGNKGMIKKGWHIRIMGSLFSFALVSFFAILGTLPLVMFYFNQVSLVGIITNLLIVPIIGFVVVPLGLISVLLYPLSIFGASICIKASAGVLAHTLSIVHYIAGFPFAAIKTITPNFFEICCYYILAWAILNLKRAGLRRKAAVIVAAFVILAGSVDACYWVYNRFWRNDLRVTIIDVGQGSCALVELPKGRCFLIDGGGFSDNSIFDVGERIVAPLLWRKKIKTIDTMVLSHPNADHLNGLLYIARHFNVKKLWCNSDSADINSYREFMEIIRKNRIETIAFKDMPRSYEINGARLKILYPPKDYIDKRKNEKWRNINNNSLVIKVSFGSKSILFPGDIMACAERDIVATHGDGLKSTVLIAPHHGSKTSSTAMFLEKIKPEIVIISAGWKNSFRFPNPSVLKRYNENDYRIFRTDKNGAVAISIDDRALKIKPFITSSANTREDYSH
ncbi:MAG: DNA internalization-related competence protein ComEC/Rec2 [Desulfobacteraceae bacterium]|nr:DNA internalization-related competence protein ComEC/Rec2 [Desulfobacteraceae bacterium]